MQRALETWKERAKKGGENNYLDIRQNYITSPVQKFGSSQCILNVGIFFSKGNFLPVILWGIKKDQDFPRIRKYWRTACPWPISSEITSNLQTTSKIRRHIAKCTGSTIRNMHFLDLSQWIYCSSNKCKKKANSRVYGYYTSEHLVIKIITAS